MATIPKDILRSSIDSTIDALTNNSTVQLVQDNFETGDKYHGNTALRMLLTQVIHATDARGGHREFQE